MWYNKTIRGYQGMKDKELERVLNLLQEELRNTNKNEA